ncbi:MAG TPA: hypothetical protein VK979_01635 [Guyparkeria sp.]|nr:hypothetical protein [Guyparkeria sp.]
MDLPIFLDIEASSLGRASYPIEIAWSDPTGEVETHLIDPNHILDWTDWDPAAQAVHGLSRRYLSEHGEDPKLVAGRIQAVLAGQSVYSDAPEYDQGWLEVLFRDALGAPCPVRLRHIMTLFFTEYTPVPADEPVPSLTPHEARLSEIYEAAWDDVAGQPHRAGTDVQHRLAWYRRVQAEFHGDPVLRAHKNPSQAADKARIQRGELSSEDVALIPTEMIKRCRIEAKEDFFDPDQEDPEGS